MSATQAASALSLTGAALLFSVSEYQQTTEMQR
jgi:hypothetical protein